MLCTAGTGSGGQSYDQGYGQGGQGSFGDQDTITGEQCGVWSSLLFKL